MYQYLKRFLNQQVEINVVFPDDGILKATLLKVDSIGVAVFDHETDRIVAIPFSSGVTFSVSRKDLREQ